MKIVFLVSFISLALFSCNKENTFIQDGNTELIGSWINPQYTDTVVIYTRANNLVENQYGITFKSGDKLVERQNSGWCGTPPVTTADYEGTWNQEGSLINIKVGYWGGTSIQTWKIVSLNKEILTVYIAESSYQQGK